MFRSSCGKPSIHSRASFTLVELLVVIAIVSVISVVVVTTLNPMEMLKKARDSNRFVDLNTLNKALFLYEIDQATGSLGSSTVVYVSIPDSSGTCANLGLPTLPSGYTYACATTANYRKIDGTGWIPVPFTSISSGAPIGALPVDPVNTTSTGLYYTYIPGGSWELNGTVESSSYKLGGDKDKASTDSGDSPSQVEIGTNLSLLPIEYGDTSLVGYWNFKEGSGTTTYDRSRGGGFSLSNGTLTNDPTWVTGANGYSAVSLDGANDYVAISFSASKLSSGQYTAVVWAKPSALALSNLVGGSGTPETLLRYFGMAGTGVVTTHDGVAYRSGTTACAVGSRCFFAITVSNSNTNFSLFMNGVAEYTGTTAVNTGNSSISALGAQVNGTARWFPGEIDEVRLYNRALSAAEILSLYGSAH